MPKSMETKSLLSGIAILALAIPSGAAIAQTTTDGEPNSAGQIKDIIVTAQKRTERLSDVPIAVAVVGGQTLQDFGVTAIGSLPQLAPGVTVDTFNGYQSIYIRGIGSAFTQPGIAAAVATYVDGVFVATSLSVNNQQLMDIERVEVLKGPQGTLYGRNATGGAINVITRAPPKDFEGQFTLTGGNLDAGAGSFYIGGPLGSDSVRGSLTGYYSRQDSFITNLGGPQFANNTNYGARGKLFFEDGDGLELALTAGFSRRKDGDSVPFNVIKANSVGSAFGGQQSARRGIVYNDNFLKGAQYQYENSASARLTVPFKGFDLVSITGYRDFWSPEASTDADGTSANLVVPSAKWKDRLYSEELQLISNNDSKLQWTTGIFLYHEKAAGTLDTYLGPPIAPSGTVVTTISSVTQKSYAVFAEGRYALTDALGLTAGLRLTHDKVDYNGATVNGALAAEKTSKSWNDLSPKLTLDYKTGETLFYLTGSKGYKTGAFNIVTPDDIGPVNPERLWSVELGMKTAIGDIARLELSVFNYRYTNFQVTIIANENERQKLSNAERATVRGLDASGIIKPTPEWTIEGGFSWLLTARYDKYSNGQAFVDAEFGYDTVSEPFDGRRLPHAPKLSGNIKTSYDIHTGIGTFTPGANVYFSSLRYFDNGNLPIAVQKSYQLIDANLIYKSNDEKFSTTLWVKNLSDKKYFTTVLPISLAALAAYGMPRTYGVSASYKF